MKNTYDIYIKQGEDFDLMLEIRDSSDALIDLTDHIFRGQIRKTASEEDLITEFDFTVLDQVTDTGKVQVHLSHTESSAIELKKSTSSKRTLTMMTYDIESEQGGKVTRWLEGVVTFSPEVTR